ncbi:BTB/POZ protein [Rhizophagus irregularis DAOM 181602=DAOM 197198]|nr:BTB/POZ protein [Rhizophagus irregularis DAOM 181602=DAOM 197198]
MSKQFFPNLSQNYMEILEDDEHYDITIEVGEDPNVKIFRSHMIILRYRSPFLRRTLSSNKKNDNGDLTHIKLSNISPEIFQIILKYIYGGIISFNDREPSEILRILIAADQLHLQELDNFKDPILSHVKNIDHALLYHSECGPVFGNHDLNLHVNEDDDSKDYDRCWCEHECYDKKIRDTEDRFSIEDYEVFQILYRND